MSQLQDKVVYGTGSLNAGRLAADWQFSRGRTPVNEGQKGAFFKDGAPREGEGNLFFRPVPVYQEIVLDPELIAECRSGEI